MSPLDNNLVPDFVTSWAERHGYAPQRFLPVLGTQQSAVELVSPGRQKKLWLAWSSESLLDEAERLSWLAGRFPTSPIIDFAETEQYSLIVTEALAGAAADVSNHRPETVVRLLAEALAHLHTFDPSQCPFGEASWVPDTGQAHRMVVAHGQASVSSLILGDDGILSGLTNVGQLGASDALADLAAASWSVMEVYGAQYLPLLWQAYGETPDEAELASYQKAWLTYLNG